MVRILWLFFVTKIGNNMHQKCVRVGVRNSKKKTMGRLTRGHAQNEEQLLGASSRCSIKAAIADTLSAARNTEFHLGWTKAGFAEMATCKPAVWDSVLGSFKTIHPKHKEDKPWIWVATIRSDAPPQFVEQFRAMTSLHTEGIVTIAAERENKQSKSEEQLWKWLKNRSKTA